MGQSAKVRLDQWETRNVKTGRKVRHGRWVSSIFFLTKFTANNFLRDLFKGLDISAVYWLLAKEDTVLQGFTDGQLETGRCSRMKMNVEENNVTRI